MEGAPLMGSTERSGASWIALAGMVDLASAENVGHNARKANDFRERQADAKRELVQPEAGGGGTRSPRRHHPEVDREREDSRLSAGRPLYARPRDPRGTPALENATLRKLTTRRTPPCGDHASRVMLPACRPL